MVYKVNVEKYNQWDEAFQPFQPLESPVEIGNVRIGDGSLSLIAGPCAIESEALCLNVAEYLSDMCTKLGISYVFKASFDKANRTSLNSFRGFGMDRGLEVLAKIKNQIGVPVLTDVHEVEQVKDVSKVADVVQIPAFLCRQTDLLYECGKFAKIVNIKKGQFLSPEDMKYAAEKVTSSGCKNVVLTERGAAFGYRDLIVDLRSLTIMRTLGHPVLFDATHSVQQMGGGGGYSSGKTEFIPTHVRGAVAVGVDGMFVETHPEPEKALSDGTTMVPLSQMPKLLEMALRIHSTHQ